MTLLNNTLNITLTETLPEELNEFSNFVLFLRLNKKKIYNVKHDKENKSWTCSPIKDFNMSEMVEKWNNSERFKHLTTLIK